ncbi:MAG: DUF4097 family beta strand repeat protein [Clostridia bacterium]|nr:DUF4097 family beta strand repeat protein [Clostridia bacterium]
MKPTSIIFLILAVIMTAAGVLTCKYAASAAEEQDIALYGDVGEEVDGALVFTYEDTQEINRLDLKLHDVDVRIHAGADTAAIEMRGFEANSFDLSLSNKTLTIDNNASILSLLRIADSGVSFDGFRHYFKGDFFTDKEVERSIDIYLPSKRKLTKYSAELKNGNLVMNDVRGKTDVEIIMTGEGSLTMNNVRVTSSVIAEVEKGDIFCEGIIFSTADFKITDEGDFDFIYPLYQAREYILEAKNGEVTNEDTDFGGTVSAFIPENPPPLTVYVEKGDIHIIKPEA